MSKIKMSFCFRNLMNGVDTKTCNASIEGKNVSDVCVFEEWKTNKTIQCKKEGRNFEITSISGDIALMKPIWNSPQTDKYSGHSAEIEGVSK